MKFSLVRMSRISNTSSDISLFHLRHYLNSWKQRLTLNPATLFYELQTWTSVVKLSGSSTKAGLVYLNFVSIIYLHNTHVCTCTHTVCSLQFLARLAKFKGVEIGKKILRQAEKKKNHPSMKKNKRQNNKRGIKHVVDWGQYFTVQCVNQIWIIRSP